METINSHLVAVAKSLVLSENEKSKIVTSIKNLQGKLTSWFVDEIIEHFRFGSSVRDTILPRKVDEDSDIDYMVVFENEEDYKPITLLNHLRDFVEGKYACSEIYQSFPTIVLELNHIKFELVPAVTSFSFFGNWYNIPAPASNFLDWMKTNPTELNQRINKADSLYHYQIKKLIRLLKYWNVRNGKVYSSYELETYVGKTVFWGCSMLEDYFFYAVKYLPTWSLAQYKHNKVERFKAKVNEIREKYYGNGNKKDALAELYKLFPLP